MTNRELVQDSERLGISFETIWNVPLFDDQSIQGCLGNVTEWRVTQIMGESRGFHYIRVQASCSFENR